MPRPPYTPDQRKAASDVSFMRTLVPIGTGGCAVPKSDHIVGYDGKRVRTRTFAWNFWHPEEPVGDGKIIKVCNTAGCVSKPHLRRLTMGGWSEAQQSIEATMDTATINGLIGLIRRGVNRETNIEYLKKTYQLYPASLETDEAEVMRRVDIIKELVANGDEEAAIAMVGPEWGLFE